MQAGISEASLWAEGVAARLRLLQVSCADDDSAMRQQYVEDEIERSLKGIVATRRPDYLRSLAQCFPSWQATKDAVTSAPVKGPDETPEQLVARLVSVAAKLTEERRMELVALLRHGGLAPAEASALDLDVPAEMKAELGLQGNQALDFERSIKLLSISIGWMVLLDQLVWRIWKEVAPNARVIQKDALNSDFRPAIARYLSGDKEVSTPQLAQALEKSRKLIASLLTAMGAASREFSKRHYERFSPNAIQEVAQMEKRTFEDVKSASWRKYTELAPASATAMEIEIRDVITKCAEEVMVARSSGGGR